MNANETRILNHAGEAASSFSESQGPHVNANGIEPAPTTREEAHNGTA
jgi:hypothetical protein